MKILVTGKNGQVGYELVRSLQPLGEVIGVDRSVMDLADLDQVRDVIRRIKPDLIVNSAAYTAVDKAESEPELAMRINGLAPGVMAQEVARLGAAMVNYSTDYVFDGSKDGSYTEDDIPNPLNVYGHTKLAGEQAVLAAGASCLVFRTSWVYGMRGKNFLLTMLRLAEEGKQLNIVNDQVGAPTWSRSIADTTACILGQARQARGSQQWWQHHSGIYHLSALNHTTWFGFASEIFNGMASRPTLMPIPSAGYPTPAQRPTNSTLDCRRLIHTFCDLPDWRLALGLCMQR